MQLPSSLNTQDPALTNNGVSQVQALQSRIVLAKADVVVASPLRRTLQTASILCENVNCRKIVSPLISPRMFPQKPQAKTLPCDKPLGERVIQTDFPDFKVIEGMPEERWTSGVNTIPDKEFDELALFFLKWCRDQKAGRVYVVSHDGTIISYRQLIRAEKLTRTDFLKDAGWVKEIY